MMRSSVRALSFNVRYDTDSDGRDAWPNRRDAVVRLLRYHRPDVVCLQEPLRHQFESLRDGLDRYEWFGVGRVDGAEEGEFVPIGYDAGRFERVESEAFWLSETPDEPGSVGWDAAYPRVVTRVTLRERETDARVHVASVHLDHAGPEARAEGASVLRRRLGELDGPVLVCGDFNCEPDSAPYRRLVGEGENGRDAPPLCDARTLAAEGHYGPERTFHGFTGDPTERIDYVFVRDCDVSLTATLTDRRDGNGDDGRGDYPSDHFPVVADVTPR